MTKYVYVVEEYDRWGYYQGNAGKVFYKKELAEAFQKEIGVHSYVEVCEHVGFDSDKTPKL